MESKRLSNMTIVFLTNFYNHHQSAQARAFHFMNDVEYKFVETIPMSQERINLGWGVEQKPDYVVDYQTFTENRSSIQKLIDTADVVIIGSAPVEMVVPRLKEGKLTFLYSERIYKKGYQAYKFPIRLFRLYKNYGRYSNFYLLCSSAYSASDYAKTFTFVNKAYKWGYFPETKRYDEDLWRKKESDVPRLLWCGRFLTWKHPDDVLRVAERLKQDGYRFELSFIGSGELEAQLKFMIEELGLKDCVRLLGTRSPEQVREHMDRTNVFLFTSDRNEGWGAVLNESMNSGCAVVASHAIGAVPFLMKNGENGLIYQSGNVEMLYEKVKYLLDHPEEGTRLGHAAYRTITEEWTAETAAKRFVKLAQQLLDGEKHPNLFLDGPCSKAQILTERWVED